MKARSTSRRPNNRPLHLTRILILLLPAILLLPLLHQPHQPSPQAQLLSLHHLPSPFQELLRLHIRTTFPRTLTWTSPNTTRAGLGDKLKGLLFTFLLSIATNRTFQIHWPCLHVALPPAYINWTSAPDVETLPRLPWFVCGFHCNHPFGSPDLTRLPSQIVQPGGRALGRRIDLYKDDLERYVGDVRHLVIEARVHTTLTPFLTNVHFRRALFGNYEHVDEVRIWRALLQALFKPSQRVLHMVTQRKRMLNTSYHAVHARLGGDVGEAMLERFRPLREDLDETARALLRCVKKVNGDSKHLYLATDTSEFREVFRRQAEGMGFKVVTAEGRVTHVGDDGCQGLCEAVVELFMLAGAVGVTGTRSGFADVAVLMGDTKDYFDVLMAKGGQCMKRFRIDVEKARPKR